MTKKLYLFAVLMLVFSMSLGACGAPAVATEAPVVVPPTAVPATEVPPTEVPTLDVPALLDAFWATVPADKGFGSVKAAALSEQLADKPSFLVDVREPAEIEATGYIDGAINIPVRTLLQNLDKLPGLDEPIVIYCASGHRGGLGMMAMRMLGYTNVVNLNGGTGAWTKAKLPLVTGKPADAKAISTPIVADKLLYDTLNDFISNLPDGFYTVKADKATEFIIEKNPTIIDVRTQAEWDKDGYIEGAILLPFSDLLTSMDKLPGDKDAVVLIYCASGHRGGMALMALRLMGYTNVINLNGGLGAWKTAKLPVAGWVDWTATFAEFLTNLPADQGFYSVTSSSWKTRSRALKRWIACGVT